MKPQEPPKRDYRDCPECQTRMEMKCGFGEHNEGFAFELWQCPKCKNIERL